MATPSDVTAIRETFEAADQGHVFAHYDALDASQRASLSASLAAIGDPHRAASIYARSTAAHAANASSDGSGDPAGSSLYYAPVAADDGVDTADASVVARWTEEGIAIARRGELAVVLLAGGQGTRLGSADPKGMYDIGLPRHRSLFQFQAERLLKLTRLAGKEGEGVGERAIVPWYVMTSPHTHAATVEYFREKNHFGLPESEITFFQQGTLPCFDDDGKMIMKSRHEVATAPDGNGGLYAALHASGAIDDMRRRNVKHVYAYCVDNALVKPGDPTFVGFCALRNVAAGAKVIAKAAADEPVGVFTRRDGKVHVVEYSEMPAALATATDADTGKLTYDCANVALHYYSFDFLAKCCDPDGEVQKALTYHVARKKIPRLSDDDATTTTPESPNGVKLEAFIFDALQFAGDSVAFLRGVREDDFAPVKNAEGTGKDSPDTARKLVSGQHVRWIEKHGGSVVYNMDDAGWEIAPAVSYAGEGLEEIVKKKGAFPFMAYRDNLEPDLEEARRKRTAGAVAAEDARMAKK